MAIQAPTVSMFRGGKKLNLVLIMRVRTLHFVLPITRQTYLRWQKAGSLKRRIITVGRTMTQWVQLLATTQRWYGRVQKMLVADLPIIIKRTFFPAAIYLLVTSMDRCLIRRSSSIPSLLSSLSIKSEENHFIIQIPLLLPGYANKVYFH